MHFMKCNMVGRALLANHMLAERTITRPALRVTAGNVEGRDFGQANPPKGNG